MTIVAGHIGDIQPPAINTVGRPQPFANGTVFGAVDAIAQLLTVVVELDKRRYAQPIFDIAGIRMAAEEFAGLGSRIRPSSHIPGMMEADVVWRDIQNELHLALVQLAAQLCQRLVAAERGSHLIKVAYVIKVVGLGIKDRAEIKRGHAKIG